MKGRFFLIILLSCFMFSLNGKAANYIPLIISVHDTSLTINGSSIGLSDLKSVTSNYLLKCRQIHHSQFSRPCQNHENIPQIIICLNDLIHPVYLFQIIEQISITAHDYKNQVAIRRYQNYYESLGSAQQAKIDSACSFKLKKRYNNELSTIIPLLNH